MKRTHAQVIELSPTHRLRRRSRQTRQEAAVVAAFRAGWHARAEHDAEQARLWLVDPAEQPTADTAA